MLLPLDCFERIPIPAPTTGCTTVYASSMRSPANRPSNVLMASDTLAWAPMVRAEMNWDHWIEVDLLNVFRINGLEFTIPENFGRVRKINKLKIQYATIPAVHLELETIDLSLETLSTIKRNFSQALETRFLRIALSELDDRFHAFPVAING